MILGSIKGENVSALKQLKNINPKYAQHMYYRNRIVEAFAVSEYGGVDVLEQPICGKCEQPGWNHSVPGQPIFITRKDEYGDDYDVFIHNCYCPKCGQITKNTLTLREYLMQELKVPDEDLKLIEKSIYGGTI